VYIELVLLKFPSVADFESKIVADCPSPISKYERNIMHNDIAEYKKPKSSDVSSKARLRRIRKLMTPTINTPMEDIIEPFINIPK